MANFIFGKNIISPTFLKSLLTDAATNKFLPSDLINKYKDYLIKQYQTLSMNKKELIKLGLKPEIYDFIIEHTIKYLDLVI